MIIVRKNIFSKPLLESNDASLIEFFDVDGSLMALLCKQFNNNTWMLVTKDDPDWHASLIRLGYISVNKKPAEFLGIVKSK